MKHAWLHRSGAERVWVTALGWGQGPAAVRETRWPEGCDVLALYHWDQAGTVPDLSAYRTIALLAWSLGVWSAARLTWPRRPEVAVAVNGTLQPMDDDCGIPAAVFAATLEQWQPGMTARKFWRRMGAGGREPERSDPELRAELAYFWDLLRREPAAPNCYTHAVIGELDRIFPPVNQWRAWRNAGITAVGVADLAHDPGERMAEMTNLGQN